MRTRYIVSTVLYGIVGVLALAGLFAFYDEWMLFTICILIAYVAWDNFFCGTRAKDAGCPVDKHYVIPPFLKR